MEKYYSRRKELKRQVKQLKEYSLSMLMNLLKNFFKGYQKEKKRSYFFKEELINMVMKEEE